ncbi:MAG: YceI family protein [Bryobacteraceae bacterium]|jgi:polyisoprenoid-binding protein YceI
MPINKWNFDTVHSSLAFSVRHLMISKVKGHFDKWSGTVDLDDADPTASRISIRIEAASVNTQEQQRDDHLRSADFFDAGNHPEIAFESTGVKKLSEQNYIVTGNLTIHGVTREVPVEVEALGRAKDPWGGFRAGFSAKTSIDRKDFGLLFNVPLDGGGVLVGDKVEIGAELEAVQAVALGA